jgi:hypothetical protein
MAILEFFGQFFFSNDVFKLQEDFSEHGIRVFLENGLGSFQTFLFLQISDKPEQLKRFQKQFWKLAGFRKIPCGLILKPLNKGVF